MAGYKISMCIDTRKTPNLCPRGRSHAAKGFTLIEILIVVTIISILAAIAIVNLQTAQTRSKVARAKSDMRTIATGLESLFVSNRRYPSPLNPLNMGSLDHHINYCPNSLSTPVAYLTNIQAIADPFPGPESHQLAVARRYGYETVSSYYLISFNHYGPWILHSRGPDSSYDPNKCEPSYDPSNGTISRGNIYRSQTEPDFQSICTD